MDWNQRYQNSDIPWEKGFAAPPLAELLEKEPKLVQGTILVPGCGLGHDVRLLAQQSGCLPHGLDIAPLALERARAIPHVAGEVYHLADFLELPSGFHGAYDWLFEHTCLCALKPELRVAYVESAWQALRPEGKLLGIFYVNVDDPSADHPPYEISSDEIDELFGERFRTVRQWVPGRSYPSREGREQMRILVRK